MKGMSNTEAYFMRMAGTLYRSAYEEGYADGKKNCRKWINIKDRKPDKTGFYLVWDAHNKIPRCVYCDANTSYQGISYWMELPEPQEESDGELE